MSETFTPSTEPLRVAVLAGGLLRPIRGLRLVSRLVRHIDHLSHVVPFRRVDFSPHRLFCPPRRVCSAAP